MDKHRADRVEARVHALYFKLLFFFTKRFDSCICPSLYIHREKIRKPVNNLIGTRV